MLRKLTTFVFIASLFLFSSAGLSAQTINVQYESVNPPDGISYVFKRVQEKIGNFLSLSNGNKVSSYRRLVNVRLAELKFIIENKKQAYFEKSTQRYFTTAGELTSLLISKNLKNDFGPVTEQLQSHIPILEKLRDSYDPRTAEWRFVEDDINYIKGYMGDLSK